MTATDELEDFYSTAVSVEAAAGSAGLGQLYDAAVTVQCLVVDAYESVRGPNGEIVTSSTKISTRPENAAHFTPNARVTIAGRQLYVISTSTSAAGTLDLPAHCRVMLR